MDVPVVVICIGIIIARIMDVSLGTLRTVFVVQGRRGLSWVLGFFEILIWVAVVSQVITNLAEPAYAISYAIGYATGNVVGITFEKWIAFGDQVVRVYTQEGEGIARQLRSEGFRVTTFQGDQGEKPIDMLFIEIPRRKTSDITLFVREIDPECFYIIDDVRAVSRGMLPLHQPTGWRAVLKKK